MRDERLRIGPSQDEFATVGGVARRSQSAYESDERSPDASYLLAVREIGVDIGYVLTGERSTAGEPASEAGGRDADEADVLAMYRQLNDAGKASLHARSRQLHQHGRDGAGGAGATREAPAGESPCGTRSAHGGKRRTRDGRGRTAEVRARGEATEEISGRAAGARAAAHAGSALHAATRCPIRAAAHAAARAAHPFPFPRFHGGALSAPRKRIG